MIKKVFITGISGFIGKHLCDELSDRGIDFFGVSKNSNRFPHPAITKDISILDKDSLREALEEYQPDAIVHLAAIASATHEDAASIYEVNVCGSENLLKAAKAVCPKGTPVLLASTAGVYGNQDYEFYDEELQFSPVNHYSYSKMVMEILCNNFCEYLNIKIVRPFNIIGTGQNQSFVIPKLVKAFASKSPRIPLGNMDAVRDYTDVKLCVYSILEFLCEEKSRYQILNICSGVGNSVKDAFEILTELTGFRPKIDITSNIVRENEVWRLVGSNKRLSELIGSKYEAPDLRTILKQLLENEGVK